MFTHNAAVNTACGKEKQSMLSEKPKNGESQKNLTEIGERSAETCSLGQQLYQREFQKRSSKTSRSTLGDRLTKHSQVGPSWMTGGGRKTVSLIEVSSIHPDRSHPTHYVSWWSEFPVCHYVVHKRDLQRFQLYKNLNGLDVNSRSTMHKCSTLVN